jgi:hypothetical protein
MFKSDYKFTEHFNVYNINIHWVRKRVYIYCLVK